MPLLPDPPQCLQSLLQSQDVIGKQFRQHIHQYNASLAFTSLGAKLDDSIPGQGPYVFRIHGELYHHHGCLLPEDGQMSRYTQLYIFDPSQALGQRLSNNDGTLSSGTLNELQEMMHRCNPFIHLYQQAAERLHHQPVVLNVQARLTYKSHTDRW